MPREVMNSEIDSYMNRCRACMKEGGKMMSMYDDKISKIDLPYKLAQLASIQIDKYDGLPNILCSKCAYRTDILYNFRQEVQESDKKFRMILENKRSIIKEELDKKNNEDNTIQTGEPSELNISNDAKPVQNANPSEYPGIEMLDNTVKCEQYEFNVTELVENGEDNKDSNIQLNNLLYNLVQETSEDQMNVQLVKTEISEEISKMFASQDVTIMYIPKSAIESMSVENVLTSDLEQVEIENGNGMFAVKILNGQENEETSSNIYVPTSVESNATRKNKRTYWERQDDTRQSKDKKAKLNESNSDNEQVMKADDSDGSDSDYFIDTKDNILGSVNDAIIRIKEVKQEDGIEYQCTLCLQNYKQLPDVLLHTVGNHVPSSGPFFCMLCEKDCESRRELRAHVKTHTGKFPYSCFICKKAYNRKRYLKRHMVGHPDFPRHRCPKCGCRFKSKSELESHATMHKDGVPFTCNQCPREFNHKGNYKRHLITHLDPQGVCLPKYPCKYCDKRFPNNRTLETHTRVHTGERPFKCEICNKSFSQRGNLLNHTRIHSNPRSYTCEVCGKSFNQRATLRDHSLLHTGEKPHVCTKCGKAFTVSAALRRHMFNHADDKPFRCDTCGMGFVGKYDLRRHMRVHEDRSKEKRRKNAASKLSDSLPQESEESPTVVEEPDTETILVEQVFLSQDVTEEMHQVESEKENEDALFNL